MKKYLLLTAAAATAMVAASPALAGSLSARVGVGAPINATPTAPYRLASELNFGTGVAAPVAQVDTLFRFNTPLQPGSYTVTMAYSGATITTPLSTATVTNTANVAPAPAAPAAGNDRLTDRGFEESTVGGPEANTLTVTAQTANSITFSLFIPVGNTVAAIYAAPAINVTGNVQVTASATNQITNAVVDPAVISTLITTNNRGFATTIDRGIGAASGVTGLGNGAGTDTRVAEGAAPVFTTRAGDAAIGEVITAVSGNPTFNAIAGVASSGIVYRDLNNTQVSLADVVSTTVTINGNLAGWTTTPASTATTSATGATITYAGAGTANAVDAPGGDAVGAGTVPAGAVGTQVISIAPTSAGAGSPQLAPTELPASVQLTLGAMFAAQPAVAGAFEHIQTDGFSYIVPWVAGSTLAAANGNTTVIRVSNIATDYTTPGGRVYGQLYNPSNAAGVTNASRSTLLGTIGSSGEVLITSGNLEAAFGNFGRGDLRLTITTTATTGNTVPGAATGAVNALGSSNITVKRVVQQANGGLTEILVLPGDASSTANDPNTSAARY